MNNEIFFPFAFALNKYEKQAQNEQYTECMEAFSVLVSFFCTDFPHFTFEELHFILPVRCSFCCWVFTIAVAFRLCIILLSVPVPLYIHIYAPLSLLILFAFCSSLHDAQRFLFSLVLKPNFDPSIFSIFSFIHLTSVYYLFFIHFTTILCWVSMYCIHISAF